jgi:hypothetical protein
MSLRLYIPLSRAPVPTRLAKVVEAIIYTCGRGHIVTMFEQAMALYICLHPISFRHEQDASQSWSNSSGLGSVDIVIRRIRISPRVLVAEMREYPIQWSSAAPVRSTPGWPV